jgi:apolipoprotein N-acyltransferase
VTLNTVSTVHKPWAWAILSGILLTLCFPPSPLGPVSFVALVPLGLAIEGTAGGRVRHRAYEGLRAGFLAGLAFFGSTLYWILFLPKENLTYPPVLIAALLLMVAYLSIYPALFGAGYAIVRPAFGPLVSMPVMWIAAEYLRSQGELGFPWASLAYSLYNHPSLIQGASLAGMWGVGLWVACVNALVLKSVVSERGRARVAWAGAAAIVVLAGYAYGRISMRELAPAQTVRAALIQPNVPVDVKWDPEHKDEIIERLVDMTLRAPGPLDIVVWPETAVPSLLLWDPETLSAVRRAAAEKGVPIVTGFPHVEKAEDGTRHSYNSAIVVRPDGSLSERYDKIHLVPFSERFPFQSILPFLNSVDFGQSDFSPGGDYVVFDTSAGRFSVLICFESLFPEISRRFVLDGADFLLNITNDAWFGKSQAPLQHASMAVFRAVEHRIGIGRAANTGISTFIDRCGRMHQSTKLFTERTIVGPIEKRGAPTFYTRHGDFVAWLCAAAAVALLAGAAVGGRRRAGRGAGAPAGDE